MTLDELKILYQKVSEDDITLQIARDKLFTGKRAWLEKDWIDRKENFLESECEQCGSTEDLIV